MLFKSGFCVGQSRFSQRFSFNNDSFVLAVDFGSLFLPIISISVAAVVVTYRS